MTDQENRISRGLAAIVASTLNGSHQTLNSLFLSAGAPEPIPEGSHAHKWRDWLVAAGRDPSVNNFEFIGSLIEEFMDVPPLPPSIPSDSLRTGLGKSLGGMEDGQIQSYRDRRKRLEDALEAEGLQYFRGGRIIPTGSKPAGAASPPAPRATASASGRSAKARRSSARCAATRRA